MINPFEQKTKEIDAYFMDWKKMNPKPYDKRTAEAFTKVRLILMNGTEFESNWFLHQFARHTSDNELRRQLALIRAQEQQQQKRLAALKPDDENILETTIAYEQLAIELTALLSQMDSDENNVKALNFALLEDFDHLYRFANLLKTDYDIDADMMVGRFTEIMPARPTISEHRYPIDNVKRSMNSKKSNLLSVLVANIITAAEQQTMNYYMNVGSFYPNAQGRKLFAEIALIEEQHVTQYESLIDAKPTWLECWVMHEYTEAYLYYSMYKDETDAEIKKIYKEHFDMEAAHLKFAAQALKKFERTDYAKLVGDGTFPKLLCFDENKEFIRKVIASTVTLTGDRESYIDVAALENGSDFAKYQNIINAEVKSVPSHDVIKRTVAKLDEDYRYQDGDHPVSRLASRTKDNTELARP